MLTRTGEHSYLEEGEVEELELGGNKIELIE